MKEKKLTQRQQQILDFIISEINRKGYPPSVREIGKAVGLSSSSTVHNHLTQLEKKGFIRRDPTKPRALEIFDFRKTKVAASSSQVRNVPVVGRIAAGEPILAEENIEEVLSLPADLITAQEVFALKVQGDSMIEAGILANDYIVVKKQPTAENGDIVVALMEDEATVKRFYKEKECVRLQPENPVMEPITTKDVTIIGKAIAVLRKL